jgi:putative DNA primase/helicase
LKVDVNSYFEDHSVTDFLQIKPVPILDELLEPASRAGSPEKRYEALRPIMKIVADRPELQWKEYAQQICKKVNYLDIRQVEKSIRNFHQNNKAARDERGKFRPIEIVEAITEGRRVISSQNGVHIYENSEGIYKPWPYQQIDQEVIRLVGRDCQSHHLDSARKFLMSMTYVPQDRINPPNLLALQNGVLNLETGELSEHSPDHLLTLKCPVKFDLNASCPKWETAASQLWPDAAVRMLAQEMYGYLFMPHNNLHRAFVKIGEGATGKSLSCYVMEHLIGSHNCSFLLLSQLREKFKLEQVENKLANFSHEVGKRELLDDALFKALVGQDPLVVERKNRDAFPIRVRAKFIIATNSLPTSNDKTSGLFRRLIIIPFKQTFEGKNADPDLRYRLIEEESSGILNWALLGLSRLRDRGRAGFNIPEQSQKLLQRYRADIDPTIEFSTECLQKTGLKSGIWLKEMVPAFGKWAKHYGLQPMGRNSLRISLERTLKVEFKEDDHGALFIPGYGSQGNFWNGD